MFQWLYSHLKHLKHYKLFINDNSGAATLPTVIALTILVVAMSIGLTAMSVADSLIAQGYVYSGKALLYAETGAKDALIKIARNRDYICNTPAEGCYQIDFVSNGCSDNEGCARITATASGTAKVVVSEGRVKGYVRKVKVDVTFDDSLNGEIKTAVWSEVTN